MILSGLLINDLCMIEVSVKGGVIKKRGREEVCFIGAVLNENV